MRLSTQNIGIRNLNFGLELFTFGIKPLQTQPYDLVCWFNMMMQSDARDADARPQRCDQKCKYQLKLFTKQRTA